MKMTKKKPSAQAATPTTAVMFKQLIEFVAKHYDVSQAFLTKGDRSTKTAISRQVAMYLCRTDIGMKFDAIATKFDRSRPTVIRSVRKTEEAMRTGAPNSTRLNADVAELRRLMLSAGMPPRKPPSSDAEDTVKSRVLTRRKGQAKSGEAGASKAGAKPPRKAPLAPRQAAKQSGAGSGKKAA